MSQSMLSGVTGLMAHQRKLDVVANNLANLNTAGYKSQRILFSDLGYANLRPAGASNNSFVGGTNPQQTGFGVGISQIARNHSQGILTVTGGTFDFAMDGEGFFITSIGEPRFTRSGAFALDGRGFLVDPSNGAFVQRLGSAGEGADGNPAFQTQGNTA
ncbi:MAG TPA: flagellar hook-basal body complex protein, partial [Pirellulaceae bacterium]|nr:flagellar hook-basal body complex protein [Pirellulaceae bacterium]